MPVILMPYRRGAAVAYAHYWAYRRNSRYYDYADIGGDCTNFASQCLYAASRIMNFTPTYGWYYISPNEKAPAWTGVEYLYRFLTRQENSVGPLAEETTLSLLEPGDILQLSFDSERFTHTLVVVNARGAGDPEDILLAAHSQDADNRPLSTYDYRAARALHIVGVNKPRGPV